MALIPHTCGQACSSPDFWLVALAFKPAADAVTCHGCVQIAGLMTNLTQEYTNFLNFLTTAPSAFNVFKNDATLLNAQLNAVSACITCTVACPLHTMVSDVLRSFSRSFTACSV